MMEPYRPLVDRVVKRMITLHDDIDVLSQEKKRDLLSIPTIDVTIDGKNRPLMVAVDLTISSLNKCFSGESKDLLFPEL